MKVVGIFFIILGSSEACSKRSAENGTVCVCNSTYCDTVENIGNIPTGYIKIYYTSDKTPGFNVKSSSFCKTKRQCSVAIRINKTKTYQRMLGFGGAFTDATVINIKCLSAASQKKLMESYFGKNGIEYSLCRVPLGGTDFSLRPYSYDDVEGDYELKHFMLQDEDLKYKIPIIREALALSGTDYLKLFTSCWTAPPWMKNCHQWQGYSMLKPKYFQVFVNYMVKFLDAYTKYNISFWGITTGNEPLNGFFRKSHTLVNSMGWTPFNQNKWIQENLGPTLRNSIYNDIKIMAFDDATITLPYAVPIFLNDDRTLQYIDGVATHWYWDKDMVPEVRNQAKTNKKDIFLLSSESCFFQTIPFLGSWNRASEYIASIMEPLEQCTLLQVVCKSFWIGNSKDKNIKKLNGSRNKYDVIYILPLQYIQDGFCGWIDWNMVLDLKGGPTYINFTADAAIVINNECTEFYKQPLFYAMGHFSKFVVPDAIRIGVEFDNKHSDITAVAFLRPDNLIVVTVFNNGTGDVCIQIEEKTGYSRSITIQPKSLNTIIYRS